MDDLTCDDCDTGYKGKPETGDLPYAAALRAFQGAPCGPDAPNPAPTHADAPTGPLARSGGTESNRARAAPPPFDAAH